MSAFLRLTEIEAVLLQEPAGPPFVHAGLPGPEETDPGPVKGFARGSGPLGPEVKIPHEALGRGSTQPTDDEPAPGVRVVSPGRRRPRTEPMPPASQARFTARKALFWEGLTAKVEPPPRIAPGGGRSRPPPCRC